MDASERVFADANYFVALLNPSDGLHGEAAKLTRTIGVDAISLVVSSFIFLEAVTVLSHRRGKEVARHAGAYLKTAPAIHIVHIDEFLQESAWNIFQRIPDKNISFVDCSTIAVMKAEHITRLLTFDMTDFRKLQDEYAFSFFR